MCIENGGFTSDNPSFSLIIWRSIGNPSGGISAIDCRAVPPVAVQSIASERPVANVMQSIENASRAAPIVQSIANDPPPVEARYLQASVTEATRRAYRQDLMAFLAWGGDIPAVPTMIARYLAEQAGDLSPATLQRRAVAIGKAHRMRGLPDPTKDDHVRATLRGIRRVHGRPPKQAAPLLREDLLAAVDGLPESLVGIRDRALLLIGFAGGFRRSELVALQVEDVAFVAEGLLLTLRRSKTDQEGRGRLIGIPWGRTRACPAYTSSYTVTWSGVSGATSYDLQEQVNGGGWTTVQSANALSWGASGKVHNTTYGYIARGCNAGGCGPWSAPASVYVWLIPGTPSAPSLSVSPGGHLANVTSSWPAVANATHYQVEVTAPGEGVRAIVNVGTNGYNWTAHYSGVAKERVTACTSSGCSGWSGYGSALISVSP